jgi:hypothetical protein
LTFEPGPYVLPQFEILTAITDDLLVGDAALIVICSGPKGMTEISIVDEIFSC